MPNDWQNSNPQAFEGLASSLEQIHKNAYTASVKAVNKFVTIRNYLIGYYIVEYEQKGLDRAKCGEKLLKVHGCFTWFKKNPQKSNFYVVLER